MAVPHSPASHKTTYTYDKANQLVTVIDRSSGRTTFQYDALGREQSYQHANGALTTWSYDAASQVKSLEQLTSGGSALYAVTYTYDRRGNRRQQSGTDGTTVQWAYDNTDRLTSERRTGTSPYHVTHTYDAVGNRLVELSGSGRTTFSYDAANQLTVSDDPAGNRTTYTYDGVGNLIEEEENSSVRDFAWNVDNRLILHDGSTTNQYNADGLLVKTQAPSTTRTLQWDGQNLLTDTYDDGQATETSIFVQTADLYGKLLARYGDAGDVSYLFDALGSTVGLTNGGTSLASYVYQAYGKIAAETGSTSGNPFTWVGRYGYYRDGLASAVASEPYYYVRARYYGSKIARWLSQDPLGYEASPWNLYEYVGGRPITIIDPSGRVTIGIIPPIQGYPECTEAQWDTIKDLVTGVCDWLSGDKPKAGWPDPNCIGPNLRDCLKEICKGTIFIDCNPNCNSGTCAEARFFRSKPRHIEYIENMDMPCTPSTPPPNYERAILFCMDGISSTKPCGSTKPGVVLHELIHHCNQHHTYDRPRRGTGSPEACERACFGADENNERFENTPPECKCECTPRK